MAGYWAHHKGGIQTSSSPAEAQCIYQQCYSVAAVHAGISGSLGPNEPIIMQTFIAEVLAYAEDGCYRAL